MSELEISNISKDYGLSRALHPVSITVERGEFVTILGPSGCGKSTLLRILTGISQSSGGEIRLGGKRIDQAPPEARDIAMVFQSYALFPHMSVAKNLGFGLKMKKVPKDERARRIAHALEICNLAYRGPHAAAIVRRAAAARGAGARHCHAAKPLAVRRAALEPRRQASRHAAP